MSITKSLPIPVQRVSETRLPEVDWDDLEFGKYFTDHMLICDYADGDWSDAQIIPFGDLRLSPVALALHYGQTIFEGMKAFGMEDGAVNIFRPYKHHERLSLSAERLCMPVVPQEIFIEGLRRLVELDKAWVPAAAGSALYIRPFMIATEARLRVKVSGAYRFVIVATPVGSYFQQPVRVKVERDFVRAARGGTGYAKCGGNYGASMYPTQRAREEGYDQVLWTDGKEHRFIEESGAMNVFFVVDGVLITPPLSDSILDGVTRDSLLKLAVRDGIPVAERPVDVEELKAAFAGGRISEAFGSGTAAVISPIGVIGIDDKDYVLPAAEEPGVGSRLKAALENIRYGKANDTEDWNFLVK
ncbi:branched-chain amino acid aminotransferase [Flavitalea sp. BT771]|uniref:branched-chain amino acid aminotransferase n=1 Tax=Flavitalea sp. BT771 TaxID=3063329 RepID=UPI0026E44824|nr:branched-chain amino acid aminotransferase [Flavitalea sp. BT771]MDO6433735.1 branched-chain amino acid aminotransferase [Flavitalea sp. BT771]MDV6222360.1 branched-chain amino acid aminotransferase [Flavitalea sp. BT771]